MLTGPAALGRADVIVVGGGIVGLATALAVLERPGRSVVVLEAESSVGAHQTGHNSGVLHSGLYYRPGSIKAMLCRSGLDAMYRFCDEENLPHRRCGKLVVAATDVEVPRLDALETLGRANGVALRRVPGAALVDYEPAVVGRAGLWVEETGVVDFSAVARAMAARIARSGGEVRVENRVVAVRPEAGGFAVETTAGRVLGRALVTCGGAQADRLARLTGADPGVRIVTFRGEYFRLRPDRARLIRGLVYPVPDPALPFLGVHLTRGIDGTVEAGPNAVLTLARDGYRRGRISIGDLAEWFGYSGFWRFLAGHWRTGVRELARSLSRRAFVDSLRRMVPTIGPEDLVRAPAGVRAQALAPDGGLVSDFAFVEQPGIVHVLNAPSPAATASLAIGRAIAERVFRHLA